MCYFCGSPLPEGRIYKTTLCPDCDREIKTCHNCKFFSPGDQYDCRESITDPVFDKDSANFCDYFAPQEGGFSSGEGKKKSDSAKDKFNNLFGD